MRTWRRVLELSPGHSRALRVLRESYLGSGDFDALEELYGSQNDWEGLSEVLSNAADRAKDNAGKISLSYRAAKVYEEKLNQPERAFRSVRSHPVRSSRPTTRAARSLLAAVREGREVGAAHAAVRAALREGRQRGRKARNSRQIGGCVWASAWVTARPPRATRARPTSSRRTARSRSSSSKERRARGRVGRLSSTCWKRGSAPWRPSPPRRPTRRHPSRRRSRLRAARRRRARRRQRLRPSPPGETPSKPAGRAAHGACSSCKLARVYSEELSRPDDAVKVYKGMLERDPSDADAASELENILRRHDRRDDLRWLLELRVTSAAGADEQLRLLGEWATLEEAVFEAPSARSRCTGACSRSPRPTSARCLRCRACSWRHSDAPAPPRSSRSTATLSAARSRPSATWSWPSCTWSACRDRSTRWRAPSPR